MIRYSSTLTVLILAIVSLLCACCWLLSEKSWEAALTFIGAITAYVLAQRNILIEHFKFGSSHHLARIAEGNDYDASVPSSLLLLTAEKPLPNSDIERVLYGAYSLLFRRLKILAPDRNGGLKPVSERAGNFLKILALSADKDIEFAGEWRAQGTQNPAAASLARILFEIEDFRVKSSGGASHAIPIRTILSSLVLIKGSLNDTPVFLMRWSDAWGGYYWFIGGIQDISDTTAEICALREIREELGLLPTSIQQLSRLTTALDKRISSRQAVLTEYRYSIYGVALEDECKKVSSIIDNEFFVGKSVGGGYPIQQRCRWMMCSPAWCGSVWGSIRD